LRRRLAAIAHPGPNRIETPTAPGGTWGSCSMSLQL
jgi:hypothetical protein